MDKVKMLVTFSKEDVEPKEALEVVMDATSLDEMHDILPYLMYYFVKAIRKAKADDKVKADAIFHLGEFFAAFSLAVDAIPMAAMFSIYGLDKGRLYSYMQKHLIDLVRLYADVKNGTPLEDVADKLATSAIDLRALVRYTNRSAYSILRDMYKGSQSVTVEA